MTRLGQQQKIKPGWILLGVLLLLALIALGFIRSLFGPAGGDKYTLQVKRGMNLSMIARELEEKRIIKNADALRYEMKRKGTAGKIQEGLYDFNGQMNIQQVANVLSGSPRFEVFNVTIPEGRRIKDLPAIFEKAGVTGSKLEELKAALNDASLSEYTSGRQQTLEGFIFPATYEFRLDQTPQQMVKTMISRMNSEFSPEHVSAAKALGLDVYEWVTLASIVQSEAANNEEMPIIAGIFLNRLRDGIALGSDPTVAYGLGKDLPQLNRYEGDFQKDHVYNTYTRRGLPLGPICNPGQAALLSVLSAQRKMADGRDALYFLHAGGKIYVNHTYDEHKRDNALYR